MEGQVFISNFEGYIFQPPWRGICVRTMGHSLLGYPVCSPWKIMGLIDHSHT